VWPGYTVFPDWMSANGVSWWVKEASPSCTECV
jgi:alpha-glucosidase